MTNKFHVSLVFSNEWARAIRDSHPSSHRMHANMVSNSRPWVRWWCHHIRVAHVSLQTLIPKLLSPHSTPNNPSSPCLPHQLPLLAPWKPKSLIAVEDEGDETREYKGKAEGGDKVCPPCEVCPISCWRALAHMRVASAANTSMANKDYGPATVSTIFVEWIGLNHVLSYVHL